jgi:hypothetical protein
VIPRPLRNQEALPLPTPVLAILVAVVVAGAIAVVAGVAARESRQAVDPSLAQIARAADCRVSEFDGRIDHNPPVTGRFVERDRAADGSYAGRRSPSLSAAIHSLYHGRVLVQYRPDLPPEQVARLDRLVSSDSDRVLLYANQTQMQAPVAATSYLSVMTCSRVDGRSLHALRVYRDRRRGFGQAF